MGNRYVVIMAGGKGERFWPESRLLRPKHLLPVVGEKPMLTQAVERLEGFVPYGHILIITNREQQEAVREICPMLPAENIIAEPVGRDTAAAVGLAMVLVKHRDPQATLAMLPADHVIRDQAGFQRNLDTAFAVAETNPVLVTIGIQPAYPATGFGYIQKGDIFTEIDGLPIYGVRRFVEKPDLSTAEDYLASGDYFWNAGMFVWSVDTIDRAFSDLTPGLHHGLLKLSRGLDEGESLETLLEELYPGLEKISVDYAIMEKSTNVATLQAAFDWDDVGSWPAVAHHWPVDAEGNVTRGAVQVRAAKGNVISARDGHLVAAIGVDDLIIVQTADATLVCAKERAQEIKQLVQDLGAEEALRHLV